MDMLVGSLIQDEVDTLDMDVNVAQVEIALSKARHAFIPLIDKQNKCFGVISSRDLIDFHALGNDPDAVPAWEICSHKLIYVESTVTVSEAGRLMLDHGIHHLLVLQDGVVAGVISTLDVIRVLLAEHPV